MKLLSILLGVCFIFSVSQKAFACPCNEGKSGKAPASTMVADAKDATKADAKAESCGCEKSDKQCGCEKDGKECACQKAGKECKCGKHKKDKAHSKHGKDCGCDKQEA